jgi:plasmid stabilization system protein ParE
MRNRSRHSAQRVQAKRSSCRCELRDLVCWFTFDGGSRDRGSTDNAAARNRRTGQLETATDRASSATESTARRHEVASARRIKRCTTRLGIKRILAGERIGYGQLRHDQIEFTHLSTISSDLHREFGS